MHQFYEMERRGLVHLRLPVRPGWRMPKSRDRMSLPSDSVVPVEEENDTSASSCQLGPPKFMEFWAILLKIIEFSPKSMMFIKVTKS